MLRSKNVLFAAALAIVAPALVACGGGSMLPATPGSASEAQSRIVLPMDTAGGTPFAAACKAATRRPMDTAGGTPFAATTTTTTACTAAPVQPADTAGGTPFLRPMDTAGGTPFGL